MYALFSYMIDDKRYDIKYIEVCVCAVFIQTYDDENVS